MGLLYKLHHALLGAGYPAWTAFLSTLGLGLFFLVFSTLKQYYRLSHIKGPPTTGFSKYWLVKAIWGPKTYLDYWEANKRYGSIARIGPNDLLTSDIDLWKHMCAARSPYVRSYWSDGMRFNPKRNNVLSSRDEREHSRLRNKMAAGYSGRAVENLEGKIDQNILELTKLINRYALQGKPLDLGFKVQYFTLDVISDVAFGKPLGFMRTDSDVYDYIRTTERTVRMAQVTAVLPWLAKILTSSIFKRLMPSNEDQLGFGKVMGVANEVSSERFGPDKKVERDMLGSFVAHGLSQPEAESEILVQIIAGSDTTATAIRSIILHVVTNPTILSKLRAEILSIQYNRPVVPDAVARTMPYLQAVIKEGLRIWPPITSLQSKKVPAQGETWKGVYLPGGTHIGYGGWGMFHNNDIFGDDAAEFRPERWLDGPPEKVRQMESALEVVFSYGRFQCLGKPVALMELNKVLVHIITHFDLTICNPAKPWEIKNPGLFNIYNFWVRANKRNENE